MTVECPRCGTPRQTRSHCKPCKRAYTKKYIALRGRSYTKEETREYNARYRTENKPQLLEAKKSRYQQNPAVFLERNKRWRARNPEKFKASLKNYQVTHLEQFVTYAENRRSRELQAEGFHSTKEWTLLIKALGNVCFDCGKAVKLTRGHIVPLCRGGSNWISNIIPQCQPCNSSQGRNIHPSFIHKGVFC